MNLENNIDAYLWNSVKNNYEKNNYTGAILDAIYYLSNTIRDKTGLENDGVSLVSQAFSGNDPKIKVTKMQTESEKSIQKGLEQLLRGVYQAIRNPRSHDKVEDNSKDADVLILFIDYLINIVDQSKASFTEADFLERVFDDNFVEDENYASLLVQEIPIRKRLNMLIEVYNKRETGNCRKLKYFTTALIKTLSKADLNEFLGVISEDLKLTSNDKVIRTSLQITPLEHWNMIHPTARMRTENIILESIKEGRYDDYKNNCLKGALGTWVTSDIIDHFSVKNKIYATMIRKLDSDDLFEQDYIFHFLFNDLYAKYCCESPPGELIEIICKGLQKGDKRFYDAISDIVYMDDEWKKAFLEDYESFKEEDSIDLDDVPF